MNKQRIAEFIQKQKEKNLIQPKDKEQIVSRFLTKLDAIIDERNSINP